MTRREFLALGAASGAIAAAGVILPIALLSRDQEGVSAPTTGPGTTTLVPAQVTLYPRLRVASLSQLRVGDVVDFAYPTELSPASLFRLDRTAAGGVGPDLDIVAFGTDCTHMGCPLKGKFNPTHAVLGPCGCHFTTFDLTLRGQVVIGQATEDLPQIVLDTEGDDILAVGTMGILYGFRDNLEDAPVV
ncbi:MAG: arsenate reductase (azurin) small subunit, partial [Acidimicrobiia bacterium]